MSTAFYDIAGLDQGNNHALAISKILRNLYKTRGKHMPIIDLGEAMIQAEGSEFWAVRGKAIQSYANLEQALCKIFSLVSDTPIDIAGVIFFKIVSADTQRKIIEELFKKKFGVKYNSFSNSLIKDLKKITDERNQIIHWNVINQVDADEKGKTVANLQLRPASTLTFDPTALGKSTEDIVQFSTRCDFYAKLCNMFYFIISDRTPNMPESERINWLGLFSKKIVYPPLNFEK